MELLERLGCTVEFREEQTCCGQMHLNAGYRDEGLALVERFRRGVRRGRRDRRAVGVLRGHGARAPAGRPHPSCRSTS